MAFKVAGRPSSNGLNQTSAAPKPSTAPVDQKAFSFKQPAPVSKPVPPRPSPAAASASPAQARRAPPAAPPKPVAQPMRSDHTRWHGRSEAPPPRGSTYAEFYNWAADGIIPNEETSALALDYYMGIRAEEPEETPTFRR